MRTILLAGAVTVALAGTAFAQMCGTGIQTGATAQSGGQSGAMSCMGMGQQAQTDAPMADKPAAKAMGGMMCACCKNMAMMGGMKHEPQSQQMPEMAPKQ